MSRTSGATPTHEQNDWITDALKVDPRQFEASALSGNGAAPASARSGAPPRGGKPAAKPEPERVDRIQVDGVLVLQGTTRKIQSDPDDPFSPEIEIADIELPPAALQEPMPKVRPHNDVIIKYLQDIPEFASGRAVSYCQAVAEACESFHKYTKNRIKELTKPSRRRSRGSFRNEATAAAPYLQPQCQHSA
ncbi:MAG: hypothetical protein JO331_04500, partial [Verrucomicrobia bacterium]|nr:hypothetical protein [Verrucomicrobiota bacterium]